MIEERYCSREVSRLLEEKGFDEPCRSYYKENYYRKCGVEITRRNLIYGEILRPTHQMAIDFLREVYGIFIQTKRDNQYYQGEEVISMTKHDIERGHKPEYYATIYDAKNKSYVTEHFNDYANCVDNAIMYGLTKLIK